MAATPRVIGDEISDAAHAAYDDDCHERCFPPQDRLAVREVAGDGREKVLIKCLGNAPATRTGRPRKGATKPRPYNNGWYMVVDPHSRRILAATPMRDPENNAVKIDTLARILHLYPNLDCYIHDRACTLEKCGRQNPKLKQIKFWAVDKFHATRHNEACMGKVFGPRLRSTIVD